MAILTGYMLAIKPIQASMPTEIDVGKNVVVTSSFPATTYVLSERLSVPHAAAAAAAAADPLSGTEADPLLKYDRADKRL
ncbi:hypothetical protein GWI33_013571 [Rhynchophorus ferrugineus]|uniref:Uncharacterized protein n=1 Tax=Rhynchophorus ferrugineus TaxID=354439 RepID=A0A834M7Q5_RHYFE|nr:hypothetical protein GWI33_013571 [Rhynchophorus ferrugineus]